MKSTVIATRIASFILFIMAVVAPTKYATKGGVITGTDLIICMVLIILIGIVLGGSVQISKYADDISRMEAKEKALDKEYARWKELSNRYHALIIQELEKTTP